MVGYLFAGQGSQYIGMGKDLYETFPESKLVFEKADKVLGFSLFELCFEGPQEELTKTNNCQPAILTMSIAAWEAFKSVVSCQLSVVSFAAGLSLGEYSALVAAGVLQFEDALVLVRKRAELMNAASIKYPGKMTAIIGLDRDEVRRICLASGRVSVANLNCPAQVVISGEKEAVDKAKNLALQRGAKKVVDLEISGAFHSNLMLEAAMEFKKVLEQKIQFKEPEIPVVSNVAARPQVKISEIKENLIKQIYSPVLWEDSMRFMLSRGATKFFEFGPGSVLKGLMRRIDANVQVISIEKREDIRNLDRN